MNSKSGRLAALAATLLSGCAWVVAPAAFAAELVVPPPEPVVPVAVEVPWWTHGYIELGGRGFLNDPDRSGINSFGGRSLAKFYEYSSIKPGPFSYDWFAAGTADGVYQIDSWARNVGYSDQQYGVYGSQAGEQYIGIVWDQTPHVRSTSALTLYNGVGTNTLTLPPGLSNRLFGEAGCGGGGAVAPTGCPSGNAITAATAATIQQDILNNLHQTDLGIRRDTAEVEYRWTPTDAWDIRTNYSHMRRTGTQIDGVVFDPQTNGVRVDAPKPVADTTQNYGASAEYAGTWAWDKKFNIKVAYSGSTYTDDYNFYTVEDPFCKNGSLNPTCAYSGSNATASAPVALMSLWPNNQAHGMSTTIGADLPFTSRYMGTVSYTNMRQNDQLLPFTLTPFSPVGAWSNNPGGVPGIPQNWCPLPTHPTCTAALAGTIPVNSLAALPVQSLNGNINTVLSNNVVTTQLTPDLKLKTSYRYYMFDNDTPEIRFNDWILTDSISANSRNEAYAPVQTFSMSYIKQNAGEELTWRPTREWNIGVAYGFERYDYVRAYVNATNENSAKFYMDWKPVGWITARGSVTESARRYEDYNYLAYVGYWQWPTPAAINNATQISPAYRGFLYDNRNRTIAKGQVAIDIFHNVTLTPNVVFQDDRYLLDPSREVGLNRYKTVGAGVDLNWIFGPGTRLLLSYMNERRNQSITSAGTAVPPFAANAWYNTEIVDVVHTFIAGVTQPITNALDLTLTYTCVMESNTQPVVFANGTATANAATTGGQYPDVRTLFQRLEAIAKYTFDEGWVHQMGLSGKVVARLHYIWERNHVQNWQIDEVLPYTFPLVGNTGYMQWMAWDNPNYNVQVLAGSLAFTW
jgi:hypothetical protein